MSVPVMVNQWLTVLLSPLDEANQWELYPKQWESGEETLTPLSINLAAPTDRTRTNFRSHRDATYKEQLPGGESLLKAWRWTHQTDAGVGEWDAEMGSKGWQRSTVQVL